MRTSSRVLAERPLLGTSLPLANLAMLRAGAKDHLRATVLLPASAGNEFHGLSTTITYAFTATQRAANA